MIGDVLFSVGDTALVVQAMTGHERLGEASDFELDLVSSDAINGERLIGAAGRIDLVGALGARAVHGIITRFSAVATSQSTPSRRYRARLCSAFFRLTLRRSMRVFQSMTAADVIKKLLGEGGLPPDRFEAHLGEAHAPRRYVVQYNETDAAFLRRLCEEEGLYFRFEAREGFDRFVLEDSSTSAPPAADGKLTLADEAHLNALGPAAFACSSVRRRRPGNVTLRDYDPEKPALKLEGKAEGGVDIEQGCEIYGAPGRFRTPDEGQGRARALLESLRADARAFELETNAVSPAPGLSVEIEIAPDYPRTARPEGKLLVTGVTHAFRREPRERTFRISAIPLSVPYRLPRITPRPKISGVQSAIVTGPPGQEIHTDDRGRITVRFPWDREQPADDTSSLPVRVMQPNTPGSMLIPRVGWEVVVAFEDGDPDRPYTLGRLYNGKHPPPFSLPANKTITALSTVSSPGGGRSNAVHFDDAAGRQHMVWSAGSGKTTTVGNTMVTQTIGFEATKVVGSQSWTIGANETLSVASTMVCNVGSQSASVGGSQTLLLKAAGRTTTGSESVLIGGALLEQVGNPADGAAHFAEAAALSAASSIPGVGTAITRGYGLGKALAEGYKSGGMSGALSALGREAVSAVAAEIPAGDAIVAGADAAGLTPWSEKAQRARGSAEGGGGTGGPGGAGPGAAQAAPGHRKTLVDGVMAESIGAEHTVSTPGTIRWTTLGASSFAIGAGHSTRAVRISRLTGGVSSDTAASISIKTAKAIGRNVKGALRTSIGGALTSDAGGSHFIKAGGPLTLKVGGSMTVEGGSVVFAVGGSSVVAIHSGGVLFKATNVTINGQAVQSGKATNSE